MDGCPPQNSPSFIHTKMEKFKPLDSYPLLIPLYSSYSFLVLCVVELIVRRYENLEIKSETLWTRCKFGDYVQENVFVQNVSTTL